MCTGAFRRKMLKVQCNNQEQMLTFVKNEIIALHTYIYLASWIFEKVAPANLAIFTGTTLKPRFYDSNQPQNHTIEKGERKQGSGGERTTPHTHNFYIADSGEPVQTPQPRSIVNRPLLWRPAVYMLGRSFL